MEMTILKFHGSHLLKAGCFMDSVFAQSHYNEEKEFVYSDCLHSGASFPTLWCPLYLSFLKETIMRHSNGFADFFFFLSLP